MTERSRKKEKPTPSPPVSTAEDPKDRKTICHVRLRPESPPFTFAVKDLKLKEGEWVIVPTEHGPEVGQVVKPPISLFLSEENTPPFVSRLATTSEIEDYYKNLDLEQQGRKICQRLINALGLKMKLVRVERFFDGSKIIFFYSADGRVDFRELVKELVKELRMRVEMRQIGIRHEAKLIGGIGCCGRELCCASFLSGFDPISIKMAKAQNLPLNPNKISGFCGRLLCCLTYEYETYKEMSQDLPGLGKACETPEGQGKVVRHNIFRQAVTVAMPDGSFVEYTINELDGTAPEAGESPGRQTGKKPEKRPAKSSGRSKTGKNAKKKKTGKKASKKPKAKQCRAASKKDAQKNREKGAEKTGASRDQKAGKAQPEKKTGGRSGRKRPRNRKKGSSKNSKKKGDNQKS